jgi:hypothetical protein
MKKGKLKRDFLAKAIGDNMLWRRTPCNNGSSSIVFSI